ncbi:MAG: hypothetical protein ABI878_09005 [Acidobacteriota bacterium]
MNPNPDPSLTAERLPVSILERLVPAIGFAVAAIAGAAGAMMLQQFFYRLRSNETAGLQLFYGGVARIDLAVGIILSIAVFILAIGLLVCLIRTFAATSKSSPPGFLLFVVGGLSLLPALLTGVSIYLAMASVIGPQMPGVASVATPINMLTIASIVIACLMILVLGGFSFISFSSRSGRKYSPLILLFVIEVGMICAAVSYFWLFSICFSQTSVFLT